jgi:hypothetical protein
MPDGPRSERTRRYRKAIGYHAFNLYALAILSEIFPQHPVWRSPVVTRVLAYTRTAEFVSGLEGNKFSYHYNPAGFEVAFALETFAGAPRLEQEQWVSEQLGRCYDFERHVMDRGAEDPATLAARLYEATRLPNLRIPVRD